MTKAGFWKKDWFFGLVVSLMLLAGAALLIESSRRLANVDPTVDVAHVLTANISLPATPNRQQAKRLPRRTRGPEKVLGKAVPAGKEHAE